MGLADWCGEEVHAYGIMRSERRRRGATGREGARLVWLVGAEGMCRAARACGATKVGAEGALGRWEGPAGRGGGDVSGSLVRKNRFGRGGVLGRGNGAC